MRNVKPLIAVSKRGKASLGAKTEVRVAIVPYLSYTLQQYTETQAAW
jgi:hypothetical protein